ncbi:MAG: hypothetical protein VX498_05715, partial [Myxococcota bacterium]|nr:hypothetical protein [Myxococcota bacterium]
MASDVLQDGRLDTIPLVDLVVASLRAPGPAVLELEHQGTSRHFFFCEQSLVRIDSSHAVESLVRMLVKRKKLDESMAPSLIQRARDEKLHAFELLQSDGTLAQDDLQKECNLWGMLLLVQSFGWKEGSYCIRSIEPPTAPGGINLKFSVPAALSKGVAKRMDVDDIRALLAPYAEAAPTRKPAPPY